MSTRVSRTKTSFLAGGRPYQSPYIQDNNPFEDTMLYCFHVPLRQPQPHRGLACRETPQEPTGQDGSLTLRQGLKQTLDTFGWPVFFAKRVTFSRTFPARCLQRFQRTACRASVAAPVVNNRGPRHPHQPVAHPLRASLRPQEAHGFQKNGRGQILSLLPVAHLTVDIAVDQAKQFP